MVLERSPFTNVTYPGQKLCRVESPWSYKAFKFGEAEFELFNEIYVLALIS